MEKEKIIVSACLLQDGYKYDGTNNINSNVLALADKYEFVLVCPEVFGGLETPRTPSEIVGSKVLMKDGTDVTVCFVFGAKKCLEIAKEENITKAIVKANSPSCGKGTIYDGTFTHTKTSGNGVFTNLLLENGFEVYTEEELDLLK